MNTKDLATRYFPITGTSNQYLKCQVYYSLGGVNYFTYKNEQRGYYVSLTPVTRERGFESFTAFTGGKFCIVPAARQSKKREEEAITLFNNNLSRYIREYMPDIDVEM